MAYIPSSPPISEAELADRQLSQDTLTTAVATLIDLRQQVKLSHWNITGPNFIGIHKLFDKLAAELDVQIDAAAERQRALGYLVKGSVGHAAELSLLVDFPDQLTRSDDVLDHLIQSYRVMAAETNHAIGPLTEEEDFGTADLMTECVRLLDQHLYLLTSHFLAEAAR